ncbi:serine hydrolase domain-containing protein [Parabacteroides sp. Marseille-P3160]|uniref:serine hydrolase domain-containing protein n=1 Tax=Parabacteroides sp. Marseille-P3160 TaxID=1917887 RepID=UPI0009BB712F
MRQITFTSGLCLLLACLSISRAEADPNPAGRGIDIPHLAMVDRVVNQAIQDREIPGAVVAVVKNDRLVYCKAYGNKEVYPDTIPMTEETVFDLASVSKSISTAVSVMILLDRGRLRLMDDVALYIPGYQPWRDSLQTEREPIRIIHLLTHTSGLPSYAPVDSLQKKYTLPNPDGLIDYISTVSRRTRPGTDFNYSCLNFITLQRIVETISGETLQDFAQKNIFRPLGMKHTDYNPQGETLEWAAPTEKQADGSVLHGKVHDPLARLVNGGISGNAGVFSNAEDLSRLVAMLMNGGKYKGTRILSQAAVRAMRTIPRGFESFGRSLGWDVCSPYASNNGDLFGWNTYGHTGYTGPSISIDPDTKTAVIFLTNRVHPADKGGVNRLRALIANIVAASVEE